jgi:hypothetical protein
MRWVSYLLGDFYIGRLIWSPFWYIFPMLVCLDQEKSGSTAPDAGVQRRMGESSKVCTVLVMKISFLFFNYVLSSWF